MKPGTPGLKRCALGLGLLSLAAGCRSGTPSLGTLRAAIEAGERQRAAETPATNYLRPVAFAGPPVARAGSMRSAQLELLLARTGRPIPRGLAANLVEREPPAPSTPSADGAAAGDGAGPSASAAPSESTSEPMSAATRGEAAAGAVADPAAASPPAASAGAGPATAADPAPGSAPAGAEPSAELAADSPALTPGQDPGPAASPEAAIALALELPAPFALRRTALGAGELLCLGPAGGRRVLLRAGDAQRAALEPLLAREFARLAAALLDSPAGPLSFELALYLGPVEASSQAALAGARCSAELVLALSKQSRPAGAVPLLVRGTDPGAATPLPPDSALSAQAFERAPGFARGPSGAPSAGDQQGASIWLRQAWLDLFEPLGQLPSGEVALESAAVFGPSLCPGAPTVGLCWGPHGELQDSISLGLDAGAAEQRALWALLAAGVRLADPDRGDFDRALESLSVERRLRREAAEKAADPDLSLRWSLSAEGARSWLRRVCFDLEVDDALPTLLRSAEPSAAAVAGG